MIADNDLDAALRLYARVARLERDHARTVRTLEKRSGRFWKPLQEDDPDFKRLERKADRLHRQHEKAISRLRRIGEAR